LIILILFSFFLNVYVLLLFDSYGLEINPVNAEISRSFRPMAISVTKSEAQPAFDAMYESIVQAMQVYYNVGM
jgi:hypothetical protein